jgi:hypothetical protein
MTNDFAAVFTIQTLASYGTHGTNESEHNPPYPSRLAQLRL